MNKSKVIDALNGIKTQDDELGLLKAADELEKRYYRNKAERDKIFEDRQEFSNRARTYWLRNKDDKSKAEEVKICQDFIKRMQRLI